MTDAETALIDDLVAANHILFHQGVVDGFGHVSARHPERAGRFLLARSMAPALVDRRPTSWNTISTATPVDRGRAARSYLERFIHSEIYRARPDVMARRAQPFARGGAVRRGARRCKLRPICHMSGFLGRGAPVFEIRGCAGHGSDLLIRNAGLGAALAARARPARGGADARPRLDRGRQHAAPGGVPRGLHRGQRAGCSPRPCGSGRRSSSPRRRAPPPPPPTTARSTAPGISGRCARKAGFRA